MTTAHRPTWKAAVGRANQGGWSAGGAVSTAVSALEAPGQLSLKTLRKPIDKKKALRESLLALQEAEAKSSAKAPKRTLDAATEERAQQRLLKQTAEVDVAAIQAKYDDSDVEDDDDDNDGGDRSKTKAVDKDNDDSDGTDLDDSDSDDDDDSDDEDDEAALQAELAKLKAEREAQRQQAAAAEAAREQQQDESAALVGNPLLAVAGTAAASTTKRRWNEDVVFRHQAKGEPQVKKRFINDTVRNDFHAKFIRKFIR
uniref:Protein CWC15 homolog n=1 Tax=Amphora coffeiformis TaxID=265554 RepID=A0A7S3L841_9STRA